MQTLEPLIFILGAIAIALISAGITAIYYRARLRRISKQSWAQARLFYTRSASSNIIR